MNKEEKAMRERLDYMRNEVQQLELQARYWKAQWETKYYTLEDNKIIDEYNDYLQKMQEAQLNHLAQLREESKIEGDSEPTLNTETLTETDEEASL